jgi:hypothetical protein
LAALEDVDVAPVIGLGCDPHEVESSFGHGGPLRGQLASTILAHSRTVVVGDLAPDAHFFLKHPLESVTIGPKDSGVLTIRYTNDSLDETADLRATLKIDLEAPATSFSIALTAECNPWKGCRLEIGL